MSSLLNYLKNEFIKQAQFNFVFNPHFLQEQGVAYLEQATKQWAAMREDVIKANSLEEFASGLDKMKDYFLKEMWPSIKPRDDIPAIKEKLTEIYGQSGIGSAKHFIERLTPTYEAYSKKSLFFDFFVNRELNNELKKMECHERCFDLARLTCQQFGFTRLDFNHLKPGEEIKELRNFYNQAHELSRDLDVHPTLLGLNNKLSMSLHESLGVLGSYNYGTKHMAMMMVKDIKSTLLHEWIHAVDNFVMTKCNQPGAMVSRNSTVIEKPSAGQDEQNLLKKAYHLIRDIAQGIQTSDESQVKSWIDHKENVVSEEFWKITLGDAWYATSSIQRENMAKPHINTAIINYIISPNTENLDTLYKKIHEIDGLAIETNNIHEKSSMLVQTCLPLVTQAQNPVINNPSKIVVDCSSLGLQFIMKLEHFWEDKIEILKSKLNPFHNKKEHANTRQKDYFILPDELLARYFEANIYPKEHASSFVYPQPDSLFKQKKSQLFSLIAKMTGVIDLTKDNTQENIKALRHKVQDQTLAVKLSLNPT